MTDLWKYNKIDCLFVKLILFQFVHFLAQSDVSIWFCLSSFYFLVLAFPKSIKVLIFSAICSTVSFDWFLGPFFNSSNPPPPGWPVLLLPKVGAVAVSVSPNPVFLGQIFSLNLSTNIYLCLLISSLSLNNFFAACFLSLLINYYYFESPYPSSRSLGVEARSSSDSSLPLIIFSFSWRRYSLSFIFFFYLNLNFCII